MKIVKTLALIYVFLLSSCGINYEVINEENTYDNNEEKFAIILSKVNKKHKFTIVGDSIFLDHKNYLKRKTTIGITDLILIQKNKNVSLKIENKSHTILKSNTSKYKCLIVDLEKRKNFKLRKRKYKLEYSNFCRRWR